VGSRFRKSTTLAADHWVFRLRACGPRNEADREEEARRTATGSPSGTVKLAMMLGKLPKPADEALAAIYLTGNSLHGRRTGTTGSDRGHPPPELTLRARNRSRHPRRRPTHRHVQRPCLVARTLPEASHGPSGTVQRDPHALSVVGRNWARDLDELPTRSQMRAAAAPAGWRLCPRQLRSPAGDGDPRLPLGRPGRGPTGRRRGVGGPPAHASIDVRRPTSKSTRRLHRRPSRTTRPSATHAGTQSRPSLASRGARVDKLWHAPPGSGIA